MPTIDDAAQFAKQVIELEYEAEVSRNSETDDAFVPKLKRLNQLFADEVTVASGISRPTNMQRDELDGLRVHVDNTRRRQLVAIFQFEAPKFGAVFACHVTGKDVFTSDNPERVWYVAKTSDGWRVLGYDRACYECDGAGKIGDRPCNECGGAGWVHGDGFNFKNMDAAVASKRF